MSLPHRAARLSWEPDMQMSEAALPPPTPHITEADRQHPRFRDYDDYRRGCARQLVQADAFRDWLGHQETKATHDRVAQHPRFPEFQTWMRANKGGARICPAGAFPDNFLFWIGGGRW